MISLVKYMIKGEYNIVIDTETSMNKVDDDMNYQVKYKIKGESNIAIDTETCDGVGLYLIRPSRPSYSIKYFFFNNFKEY